MAVNWILPVRVTQFIFAIIALGLSADLVRDFHEAFGDFSISQFNYNVFTAVFCILTVIYLIASSVALKDSVYASTLVSLVIDGLNWVFWLAAFACIAALLDGATNTGEPSALVAFGVLNWILFSVTFGFAIFLAVTGRRGEVKSSTATTQPTTTV